MSDLKDKYQSNDRVCELMKNYGLEELNEEDLEVLARNIDQLWGMPGVMVQNYIIIRQLDRLNKHLEALRDQEKI